MARANPKLQQFDRQLTAVVTPALASHGFPRLRPRRLFSRPSPQGQDIVRLIFFQVGEATSLKAGRFTVEIGRFYPKYAKFLGQRPVAPDIGYADFDVRQRLGFLFAVPEDRWWPPSYRTPNGRRRSS